MVVRTIIVAFVVLLKYLSDTNAANISTDEAALLAFKAHITSDPNEILSKNWTKETNICNWIGISCSEMQQRVTSLVLRSFGFRGSIAKEIGNLSFLSFLDIGNNSFHGQIPHEIGCLRHLKYLSLQMNNLTGQIPESLGSFLTKLEVLDLSENDLFGNVPFSIFNVSSLKLIDLGLNQINGNLPRGFCTRLPNLQSLLLSKNQLTGQISSELNQCKQLVYLSLSHNQLTGSLPRDMWNLTKLQGLFLGWNNLTGQMIDLGQNSVHGGIPLEFGHLVNLKEVYLGANRLMGEVPRRLYLAENQFTGLIPTSIVNSTKLIQLDLGRNLFSGTVPMNLGKLQQLQFISFQVNQLMNDPSMSELSFLTSLSNCNLLKTVQIGGNQFNGTLPKSVSSGNWSFSLEYFIAPDNGITGNIPINISNLRNLEWLSLGNNKLIGSIPPDIGNLRNLQRFNLQNNNLDGIIPTSLCNMENVYQIFLGKNQLSGELPSCFGNITSLRELYLDSNALISHIPSTFWRNKDISILDLSSNLLNGSLPIEMGNSRSLRILHLYGNQFSGRIASMIGQLQSLVSLSLSANMLDGPIPELFEDLVSLEYLDLSSNNLSGMIPMSLMNLAHLLYFNVSFNGLMGEIPDGGPFSRILISVVASVSSGVLVFFWFLKCRKRSKELPLFDTFGQVYRRILYSDIAQGTGNFDEANLIDRGNLGLVYKGTLADGMVVAIKVFNTELQHAFRSFDVECQVLRSIRHRNLVKVISSCASFDYKVLVLQYMPNENLESWIHSPDKFLDLTQRLKVMIDVASAMEYLQGGHLFVVVHCDLKPSNILLDGDMVAKVSDFGISKLLTAETLIAHTKTLGTIGYMAPEYGSEGKVSTKGDVYSFGILLMETFTRKSPVDHLFVGDFTLKR
ncbi:putative LRR receptor-like serine/threonine-protein kinase [Capsicum chacoense]